MNNTDKMSPSELRAHDESAHADMASRIAELEAQRAEWLDCIAGLLTEGGRLAAWCCSLSGDKTFDAVRCWNEEAAHTRAAIRRAEGGSRG